MKEEKQMSLDEYIKNFGYTKEEWDKCFDELTAKGIGKGCYDDYNLLSLVIQWNCKFSSIYEVNGNGNLQ